MASKRKTSESVSDKSSKVAKVQTPLKERVVQKQNENMKIVEEVDKNKNKEEKEINDEDGDDEETENDKENKEEGEKESEEGDEEDGDENESDEGDDTESEKGDEEDGDENESDEGDDTESEEGDEDVVKNFNIDKFQVEMPIDDPTNLTGDFVVKSAMGAKFDAFRTMLMNEKLEDFFKSSCFGYFLDLPEANNARFQMSMVYDLLKRRIKYKGDDDDALENKNKKMDEIWINYCGMPVCFGMKEFAIVTGLRCHPPSEPLPKVARLRKPREKKISKSVKVGKKGKKPVKTVNTKTNKGKEKLNNENELLAIIGPSYKAKDLIEDLQSKKVLKKHKERLCLVWFVHAILWAKDINNVIDLSLFVLAQDLDAFNNYPWGNNSYFLTIEYLMSKLSPKTTNLYGFPWAFMAWAFEAIPYLRKQFNDYSKKISQPRILRWLSAKNNPKINSVDLFDPPHDIIVHSWLVPTEQELQMSFFLTLEIIDTKSDPIVDLIKKELVGATTIKREAPIVSGDADDVALDVDVDVNIGVDIGDAGAKSGGEHVDDVSGIYGGFAPFSGHTTSFASSSSSCSACKYEECKNKEAQLISTGEDVKKSLDALTSAVKELISKRGVIPSRKISESFTPLKIKRRRKSISKILSNMKKRQQIATTPLPCNVESSSGAIEEQQKL
ncbi:hypothetical protein MTR67_046610 [Solanum verrucosum]|uniref:DUF1985 domain-containing protein n=1 Tax=Solanum verrucosum TaxID=315347 RepID=A0AAF0ZXS3_SOLVR|nr:hypothetical protein MTR67_046610 [Solanum verrucosum]